MAIEGKIQYNQNGTIRDMETKYNHNGVIKDVECWYNHNGVLMKIQKKPDVYLAQDSDFVKVYGDWIYKGAALEVEIPTHINGQLVTSTVNMFSRGSNYQATPVTKVVLNHSNVTSMNYMFEQSNATILDLSSFNTSNVTNMYYMFSGSSATIGYARTQADANKFNSSEGKPAGLNFVVKW